MSSRGGIFSKRCHLKPGQALHRLLELMVSDFYRGFRVATIHANIYPGDYFNPMTSPLKVHQLLIRMRKWVSSRNLTWIFEERRGFYQLSSEKRYGLILRNPVGNDGFDSPSLLSLKAKFRDSGFSVIEGHEVLGISTSSTRRLLQKAVDDGLVVRFGGGKWTRYRFHRK